MAARAIAAKLHPMTSDEQDDRPERGRRIRARIEAGRKAKGPKRFYATTVASEAGFARQTVDNAMKGEAEVETYDAIEKALDTLESRDRAVHPEDYAVKEADEILEVVHPTKEGDVAVTSGEMVEVELHGVFGVQRVIVRSRPDLLKEEIIATIQALRETTLPE